MMHQVLYNMRVTGLLHTHNIILGECSAFLASVSDPTDDRRRHKV